MPEISLTKFVDFVIKSGTPKMTQVRAIKKRRVDGYDPSHDYYRKLRDGIVELHQQGRLAEDDACDETEALEQQAECRE